MDDVSTSALGVSPKDPPGTAGSVAKESEEETESKDTNTMQDYADTRKEADEPVTVEVTFISESGERSGAQLFEGEKNPFKCVKCDRIFKNRSALHIHLKSHEGIVSVKSKKTSDVQYECETCGKFLKYKGAYLTHLKKHKQNVESNSIIIAEETAGDCEDDRIKLASMEGDGLSPNQCPMCDVVMINKTAFMAHIQSHENDEGSGSKAKDTSCGDKDNQEDTLDKGSKAKSVIQTNVRSMRKQGKFICAFCEREFESRGGLLLHEQTHDGERKQFKCTLCPSVFKNKGALQTHLKSHKSTNVSPQKKAELSHECSICSQRFRLKGDLLKHVKKKHPGKNSKSNESLSAKKSDAKESNLSVSVAKSDNPNECDVCFKSFRNKSMLARHLESHSTPMAKSVSNNKALDEVVKQKKTCTQERFKCTLCDKAFKMKSSYDNHMEKHKQDDASAKLKVKGRIQLQSQKKPYKCHVCNQCFKFKVTYLKHMSSCHPGKGENPYECKICQKSFAKADVLNCHLITHSSLSTDGIVKCPICSEGFNSRDSLKLHLESHIEKPYNYKCKVCGLTLRHKVSADRHELTHKGRYFTCSICSKASFKNRSELTRHLKVHEKEKVNKKKGELKQKSSSLVGSSTPSVCKVCNKVFASPKSLAGHMWIHKGEKYKCDFCDKAFNRIFILKSHLKIIHNKVLVNSKKGLEGELIKLNFSNRVLFKCPACGIVFIHRKELAGHIRIHTGQKPYECSECDDTFYGRYQLQEHMKTLHPSPSTHDLLPLRFKCSVCTKAFKKRFDLTRHLRVHAKRGHVI